MLFVSTRRRCAVFLRAALLALPLALGACQSLANDYSISGNAQAMQQLSSEPINAQPWTFNNYQGLQITTEHYTIFTTVRDPLYQRLLAKTLEATYDRAQSFRPTTRISKLMECYVFGDRPQWELYTRLQTGPNAPIYLRISAGGYCQNGVFAGYDLGSRARTLSVIAHEAWHQYSGFAFVDRLPSWLDEGLATQNESMRWDGTTPTFTPELNYDRFQTIKVGIRAGGMIPLTELLRTHAGQVVKDGDRAKMFYAQVWSLVMFLEHSKYRPGLVKLLDDARDGTLSKTVTGQVTTREIADFTERWNTVAGPAYMKKYFNTNLEELEGEYRAFLKEFTSTWPPKLPN